MTRMSRFVIIALAVLVQGVFTNMAYANSSALSGAAAERITSAIFFGSNAQFAHTKVTMLAPNLAKVTAYVVSGNTNGSGEFVYMKKWGVWFAIKEVFNGSESTYPIGQLYSWTHDKIVAELPGGVAKRDFVNVVEHNYPRYLRGLGMTYAQASKSFETSKVQFIQINNALVCVRFNYTVSSFAPGRRTSSATLVNHMNHWYVVYLYQTWVAPFEGQKSQTTTWQVGEEPVY